MLLQISLPGNNSCQKFEHNYVANVQLQEWLTNLNRIQTWYHYQAGILIYFQLLRSHKDSGLG